MEFMLVFAAPQGTPHLEPAALAEAMAEMGKHARKLASQRKLRRGAPLAHEDAGARVRVRAGSAVVTDGPFAESKEVIAGFWIVDVASREEALEIARNCPHARHGIVEVHALRRRLEFPDGGAGAPYLLAFHQGPGLGDPDGSKMREMIEFGTELVRQGIQLETAPLASDPPPARVESRGARLLVTDGPFAESKEVLGGYSLVRAPDRATAIDIAKRFPHARWGTVEVREILFFDEV